MVALVTIEGLTKRFPKQAEPALRSVSTQIRSGHIVGLVGPDGSGKTTFLRLIAGLLRADEGGIDVGGLDPVANAKEVRARIAYMPQRFGLYEDLSVEENLNLYADLRGLVGSARKATFERLLDFTGLAPFTGRLVDRFGSRLILAVGGFALSASCFYLAAAQTLVGFYIAFSIARTADQGMIKIGTLPVVAKWFQVYRGRAMAMVSFIGLLGVIVMAPVVHIVIEAWGWRVAWVMLGSIMILIGVLPSVLIVRRQPEDMGLTIDGITVAPSPDGVLDLNEDNPIGGGTDQTWSLRLVILTPTFWLILVSLFVISIANAGVVLHLIPHLTEQGLGEGSAVGAISVFSASTAAANLL